MKNDQSREHSSFEKFKISDYSIRSCTTNLNIQFDFLIVLPPELPNLPEIAQRYKIDILLDQDFVEEGNVDEPFIMGIIYGKNITSSIEFTDYSVSQAIQAAIDGWVASLPIKRNANFVDLIQKSEVFFRSFSGTLVRFSALMAGAVTLRFRADTDTITAISISLFCLALGFTLGQVADYAVHRFYRNIHKFRPITYLLLTNGDQERMGGMSKSRSKNIANISFALTAVLLSFVVNIFSSLVYDIIF